MSIASRSAIRTAVLNSLTRKMYQQGRTTPQLYDDTDLVQAGLLDSIGLLDVLLEVEVACGREFDPERLDLERGLTIGKLVAAFE